MATKRQSKSKQTRALRPSANRAVDVDHDEDGVIEEIDEELRELMSKPYDELTSEQKTRFAGYLAATQEKNKHINFHNATPATRQRVKDLIAFGHTLDEIAALIGCPRAKLNEKYEYEIAVGRAEANEKVARALFKEALSPVARERVRAQEFWLKNRAGWKDNTKHEITGADGGAINHKIQIELVAPDKPAIDVDFFRVQNSE